MTGPATADRAGAFESLSLRDRVAWVTGAARGIGAATVELLRARGATVVAVDIDPVDDIEMCDVTDEEGVAKAIERTIRRFGRLDIVVNVAGIAPLRTLADTSTDLWERVLAVNLTGTFLVCREAMPHLVASTGTIVNVASISAFQGQPANAAYTASKGGVLLLTRSLAVEFAQHGVRVNAVCPGGVDTELARAGGVDIRAVADRLDQRAIARMTSLMPGKASPVDIAETIAFLSSDAARSVSGAAFVVDRATLC